MPSPSTRIMQMILSTRRVVCRTTQVREATEQYNLALKINPNAANTHYRLGQALARLGSQTRAQEEFAIFQDYVRASRTRPTGAESDSAVRLQDAEVRHKLAHRHWSANPMRPFQPESCEEHGFQAFAGLLSRQACDKLLPCPRAERTCTLPKKPARGHVHLAMRGSRSVFPPVRATARTEESCGDCTWRRSRLFR